MKNLGIIYGGISTEHDVSVMSAKSVIENIDKEKYKIHEIYINKYGKWFEVKNGEKEEIYNLLWTLKELDVVFNLRKAMANMQISEMTEQLINQIVTTKTNDEFLDRMKYFFEKRNRI